VATQVFVHNAIGTTGTAETGAKLYGYVRNTTTPQTFYTDSGLSVPASNPFTADAAGHIKIYYSDSLNWTFTVKTADLASTLLTVDILAGVTSITYADLSNFDAFQEALADLLGDLGINSSWASPLAAAYITPQPVDATLSALAALGVTAGKVARGTGTDTFELVDVYSETEANAIFGEKADKSATTFDVATLAALQATTGVNGRTYRIVGRNSANDGGQGEFVFRSGDRSAAVALDEVNSGLGDGGIWVAPSSDLTGASGAYQRMFDGPAQVDWYAGSGVTNHTAAVTATLMTSGHIAFSRSRSYVIGDVAFGGSHQKIDCNNAPMSAPAGAQFIFRNDGYATTITDMLFDDVSGNLVRATTLASGASTSATTVTVTSATGMEVSQRISIQLDTLFYHSTWITGIAGSVITIADAMPSAAASGKKVRAHYAAIINKDPLVSFEGVRGTNVSAGILIDDGTTPSVDEQPGLGVFADIRLLNVRDSGIIQRRNANNNSFNEVYVGGGWSQVENFTGNGSTTNYDLEYPIHLKTDITVRVAGVLKTIVTDYTLPASPGNRVQFVSAPANGAAIEITHFRDAIDVGFLDDPRTSTIAYGGNSLDQIVVLDCHKGIVFNSPELWAIGNITSDTCDNICVEFIGGTFYGEINQLFVGYAPTLIKATGGGTANGWWIQSLVTNRTGTADVVSGTASVQFNIASGSTFRLSQKNWRGDFVDGSAFTGGGYPTFMDVDYYPILTTATIGGGTTTKWGGITTGPVASENDALWQPMRDGFLMGFRVFNETAPGSAQTHTITMRINGSDTTLTGTITGTSGFSLTTSGTVPFADNQFISMRMDSTAGAAATRIRGTIAVANLPTA
jgi:hypothetical protein